MSELKFNILLVDGTPKWAVNLWESFCNAEKFVSFSKFMRNVYQIDVTYSHPEIVCYFKTDDDALAFVLKLS